VTTDSSHGFPVYPHLAGGMELNGLNQLWIADITYIRLETEFVYLAVAQVGFTMPNTMPTPCIEAIGPIATRTLQKLATD
jgi:hypothetical protein